MNSLDIQKLLESNLSSCEEKEISESVTNNLTFKYYKTGQDRKGGIIFTSDGRSPKTCWRLKN